MRLSLKAVLVASIGVLALAASGQGVVSIVKLSEIEANASAVKDNWLPSVSVLGAMNTAVRDTRVKLYRLVTASDDDRILAENRKGLETSLGKLAALRAAYEPLINSPEERALYKDFSEAWALYDKGQARVVALMQAGDKAAAFELLKSAEMARLNNGAIQILQKDVDINSRGATATIDATVNEAITAKFAAYLGMAIAMLAALGAMLFAWFGISRPIERMTAAMGRLAGGDATVAVPGQTRRDEIGAMAAAVQVFKENLLRTRALEEETALARAGAEAQRK
ncbi:MCP four helix bundle domain-containing protein, partial [Methylobacterium organophilum]